MNDTSNALEIENHIELLNSNFDDDQILMENGTSEVSISFRDEVATSFILMKGTKLNILLIFAPLALIGSKTGVLGEFLCFCCAGLALIPCAERLSFVTEHVAEHTNETIGALLNATFGNAPELLISSAALRNGFYRVVQLTLLGSILTNLLFVFGLSCFVGGLQWQIQELRITSGNVSIGMLLSATMGTVLPAALKLANESVSTAKPEADEISDSDIAFSRFNSVLMISGYCCYLIFQLGSHKEELDYDGDEYAKFGGGHNIVRTPQFQNMRNKKHPVHRNKFCRRYCSIMKYCPDAEHYHGRNDDIPNDTKEIEYKSIGAEFQEDHSPDISCTIRRNLPQSIDKEDNGNSLTAGCEANVMSNHGQTSPYPKSKSSDVEEDYEIENDDFQEAIMTMRCGLFWLGIVTAAISIISGIIVDTIDGFAERSNMSEVFTSVIIIPYFSNIAEQVSAVIFAYRNKMDLCIGVTVGSAIQIAQLVMPFSCLCAWGMGRSMTLYFRAYETICLLLGVICVASVLQGGTTNWLVGVFLVSVYFMIAAGFCYHEDESLSTDAELVKFL